MSTTVVRGNTLDDWLAERRRLGLDGRDELWEGVLHVPPHPTWAHAALHDEIKAVLRGPARAAGLVSGAGFALGEPDDYRVPDGGWVPAAQQGQLYMPTVTVVLEVLSPDDETFAKFDFYRKHGVREILVAHPKERWVRCWALSPDGYAQRLGSEVFDVTMEQLREQITGP